eukprot:CAMPEP_0170535742 /NCGR_PEP_ID=MMETSP0209-20121228/101766_1 /TAXON_ID=665100 ORGANISM="Litonotus pictus, Strain P1" /NCGR_SAMPLE_ID=MMETSP0209 /ASSEMBLY_ACC=CAM_ASM_000301 /LENGTH=448 /DNA_ID=CAMNT_0010837039 /DNA_START=1 /DNA_END=1347 /DNA_ORIENTATION=-
MYKSDLSGFNTSKTKFSQGLKYSLNKDRKGPNLQRDTSRFGFIPSPVQFEAELIQVKQKLNESKLIIKRLSVENLKLNEENKKISALMEKVIASYNPDSHLNFIENGNEYQQGNEGNSYYAKLDDSTTKENESKDKELKYTNMTNTSADKDNRDNSKVREVGLKHSRKSGIEKGRINTNLDINKTAEKHIKELKDNYIFKKLKETIKELKYSLEENEKELQVIKDSTKASQIGKLEKDFKTKIDECQFYKEENLVLQETLSNKENIIQELSIENETIKASEKRNKSKLEEQLLRINVLESDYFKRGQQLKEANDKNESIRYQIVSIKNQMNMKDSEYKTHEETLSKVQKQEKEYMILEKRMKEIQADRNFLKNNLEKKSSKVGELERELQEMHAQQVRWIEERKEKEKEKGRDKERSRRCSKNKNISSTEKIEMEGTKEKQTVEVFND